MEGIWEEIKSLYQNLYGFANDYLFVKILFIIAGILILIGIIKMIREIIIFIFFEKNNIKLKNSFNFDQKRESDDDYDELDVESDDVMSEVDKGLTKPQSGFIKAYQQSSMVSKKNNKSLIPRNDEKLKVIKNEKKPPDK